MVNIIRYILAFLVPLLLLPIGVKYAFIGALMCLLLNNWFDDMIFYLGSRNVDLRKCKGGVSSPVNGIVTCIEKDVEMYHHLIKCDVLTNKKYIELTKRNNGERYNHISIFLNKLNKHVVCNVGDIVTNVFFYKADGENVEMVDNCNLMSDNKGAYLNNTFIELTYLNGIRVIVTMDKYISKAIGYFDHTNYGLELLICRGSQADIYIPKDIELDVKLYQKLDVFQTISKNRSKGVKLLKEKHYKDDVMYCIRKAGFTFLGSLKSNALKTLETFKSKSIIAALLVSYLFGNIDGILFILLYGFLIKRSTKMLMYSLMNIIGYKKIMTKVYRTVNKLIVW